MNNLFHRQKSGLTEEQIIGTVSGYNYRVEEIQGILKDAGFEPGPINGLMSRQTRAAIKEFQKRKRLETTGKIDSITQLALNREKEIIKSLPAPHAENDIPLYPESALITKDAQSKAQDEVLSFRLKSKDRVKKIQLALKKADFFKDKIDGKMGPQTKRAIKAFQKSKNLNPDGVVGQKTWEELSKYLKE